MASTQKTAPYLLILPFSLALLGGADTNLHELLADLDGDGQKEAIVLHITDNNYTLTIGGHTVHGDNSEMNAKRISVLDVDKRARYRQVMVSGELDGGYGHSILYAYNGRKVQRVAGLTGSLTVSGNGKIYVDTWHGHYSTKNRYTYDEATQQLRETPQDLYFVGMEMTVKKSFAVYLKRTDRSSAVLLSEASTIVLLAVDSSAKIPCSSPDGSKTQWGCEWLLVKTSSGLLGWVKLNALYLNVDGMPSAG